MARNSAARSIDEVVRSAIEPVAARVSQFIARTVSNLVEEQVRAELSRTPLGRGRAGRFTSRSRGRGEMTKWTADRRARRVPNFVIEATGLDTKKRIVAKFGDRATFEKGKPLPPPKKDSAAGPDGGTKAAREVKAKPPTVRRKRRAAA
jgi:hypothetical protein